MSKRKRILIKMLLNSFRKNKGKLNAMILKKSNVFGSFGDNCYWHSCWIPALPQYIYIGNNVTVTADVRFCEHTILLVEFGLIRIEKIIVGK